VLARRLALAPSCATVQRRLACTERPTRHAFARYRRGLWCSARGKGGCASLWHLSLFLFPSTPPQRCVSRRPRRKRATGHSLTSSPPPTGYCPILVSACAYSSSLSVLRLPITAATLRRPPRPNYHLSSDPRRMAFHPASDKHTDSCHDIWIGSLCSWHRISTGGPRLSLSWHASCSPGCHPSPPTLGSPSRCQPVAHHTHTIVAASWKLDPSPLLQAQNVRNLAMPGILPGPSSVAFFGSPDTWPGVGISSRRLPGLALSDLCFHFDVRWRHETDSIAGRHGRSLWHGRGRRTRGFAPKGRVPLLPCPAPAQPFVSVALSVSGG
jgi:hypothetical protein